MATGCRARRRGHRDDRREWSVRGDWFDRIEWRSIVDRRFTGREFVSRLVGPRRSVRFRAEHRSIRCSLECDRISRAVWRDTSRSRGRRLSPGELGHSCARWRIEDHRLPRRIARGGWRLANGNREHILDLHVRNGDVERSREHREWNFLRIARSSRYRCRGGRAECVRNGDTTWLGDRTVECLGHGYGWRRDRSLVGYTRERWWLRCRRIRHRVECRRGVVVDGCLDISGCTLDLDQ